MKNWKTKEVVAMGILTGIVFVAQIAMSSLPNIEVVTLLFILYTLAFGKKVFFIIYAFVLLEGWIYGMGLWWVNYLYVWSVQSVITLCFRKQNSAVFWSIMSGIYGLSFGGLCAIVYGFISGAEAAFAYWIAGLGFDITHCIGNVILGLVLFRPLKLVMEKCSLHVTVQP